MAAQNPGAPCAYHRRMSAASDRYRTVADGFTDRLAGVGPDQWALPTPCTDWNVRQLAAHVIMTQRRVLSMGGGPEAVEVADDADLVAEWTAARRAMEEAVHDEARASATVSGASGDQKFEDMVGRLVCADTLLHTWDLARATGQDETLEPEVAAACLGFLTPMDEAIRRPGGFGPRLACPPGAGVQAELLAFCGREA